MLIAAINYGNNFIIWFRVVLHHAAEWTGVHINCTTSRRLAGAGIGTRSRRFADINLPRFVLEGNIPAADRIIDDFIAAAKLAGIVHIPKTFDSNSLSPAFP